MMKTIGIFSIVLSIIGFTSCYYDNYEDLYKDLPIQCDTLDVKYTTKVQAIVSDNCLLCHSPTGGQLPDLSTYQGLIDNENKIKTKTNSVTDPMPPTGQMARCNIETLNYWYSIGSPF